MWVPWYASKTTALSLRLSDRLMWLPDWLATDKVSYIAILLLYLTVKATHL